MIHKNFLKVLSCINSSKTRHHLDASERMIELFRISDNLATTDGSVLVLQIALKEKRRNVD